MFRCHNKDKKETEYAKAQRKSQNVKKLKLISFKAITTYSWLKNVQTKCAIGMNSCYIAE